MELNYVLSKQPYRLQCDVFGIGGGGVVASGFVWKIEFMTSQNNLSEVMQHVLDVQQWINEEVISENVLAGIKLSVDVKAKIALEVVGKSNGVIEYKKGEPNHMYNGVSGAPFGHYSIGVVFAVKPEHGSKKEQKKLADSLAMQFKLRFL
ncbi:hypothetical protein [Paraburkholderia sp. BR10882]|uniref:hypothetical protein n=1 Tax=unclassified Paraburkholderia TaxID=2615204 RepID=UPI0034CEBACC